MFGWFRRKKRKRNRKPKKSISKNSEITKTSRGKFMEAGDLLLKQKIKTSSGVEEMYVQPVKLEVPNMVTIGGKLDTIIEKLDKKPDKEWFENEYLETLKRVLLITEKIRQNQDSQFLETGNIDKTENIDHMKVEKKAEQGIEKIEKEVASTLIINVLRNSDKKTISEISKEIGSSRVTVWRNIKRLKKEGKIKIIQDGRFKYVSLI